MSKEIKKQVYLLHRGRKFLHAFSAGTSVISVVDYAMGLGVLKTITEMYPVAGYLVALLVLGIGVFRFESLIEGVVSMFADFLSGNVEGVKIKPLDTLAAVLLVAAMVGASSWTSFYGMKSATVKNSDLDPMIADLERTEKDLSTYRDNVTASAMAGSEVLPDAQRLAHEREVHHTIKESVASKQQVFEMKREYASMRLDSTAGISIGLGLFALMSAIAAGIMAYFQSKLAVPTGKSVEDIVQSERAKRSTRARLTAYFQSWKPAPRPAPRPTSNNNPPQQRNPSPNNSKGKQYYQMQNKLQQAYDEYQAASMQGSSDVAFKAQAYSKLKSQAVNLGYGVKDNSGTIELIELKKV